MCIRTNSKTKNESLFFTVIAELDGKKSNIDMAPRKSKRIKLATIAPEPEPKLDDESDNDDTVELKRKVKNILMLNDDCFFAILDKLRLDDLCAMGKTCERLQRLCGDYFSRYHKNKAVNIYYGRRTHMNKYGIRITPITEKYFKCFPVQNWIFDKSNTYYVKSKPQRLVDFYKGCNLAPIKTILFYRHALEEGHGCILADLFENVESVAFSQMAQMGELNRTILKFMPNLRELTLLSTLQLFGEQGDWWNESYPTLERFSWYFTERGEIPFKKFERFLGLNSNIKFISLRSKSVKTIEKLMEKDIHINELFFDAYPENIPKVLGTLHTLFDRGLCYRLHLNILSLNQELLNKHLDRLATLGPYIEGLYLSRVIDKKLADLLISFDKLKVLECERSEDDNRLTAIPSLEVICWEDVKSYKDKRPSVSVLCPHRPCNLKVYFKKHAVWSGNEEWGKLNSGLRRLPGAQILKLYVNITKTNKRLFPNQPDFNQINREHDMLEIMDFKTEIITNPFIRDFIFQQKQWQCPESDT